MSQDIRYLVDADPEPGSIQEIAPGVRWLRMPLPFRLDHINLWLLEDGDGWTIVDTGMATDDARAIWTEVFSKTFGGRPVKRIIVTHFHSDHSGLAGWIHERFGAELWMTDEEYARAQVYVRGMEPEWLERVTAFFTHAGCSDEVVDATRRVWSSFGERVTPIPPRARRVADNDVISIGGREWRVIVGRGHAPEHAALYCAETDTLIAGDQVLPQISPNISVFPDAPEENPLADFLDSIVKFRGALPDTATVLPSHKLPFTGLHSRLEELSHHHDNRLEATWESCAEPRTAMDITRTIFRPDLDNFQTGLAVAESLAHLHLLMSRGEIARDRRSDGVLEFERC